jgi:hypothetical protein
MQAVELERISCFTDGHLYISNNNLGVLNIDFLREGGGK